MKVGFVCGLADERRVIEKRDGGVQGLVAVTGADPGRALPAARRLVTDGVRCLVSFGLAGGLDPALTTGSLVISHRVATREAAYEGDAAWAGAMSAEIEGHGMIVCGGTVFGADLPVLSPKHKAELFARTGSVIVDMESAAVAQAAQEAGLPFVVVRAVSDDADATVPDYATDAIDADGRADAFSVLGGLIGDPLSLPQLIGVAAGASRAYATLRRAAPFIHLPAIQS